MNEKDFWKIRDGLELGSELYQDAAAEAYRILVENWADAWAEGYDPRPELDQDQWSLMMTDDLDEVIAVLTWVRDTLHKRSH